MSERFSEIDYGIFFQYRSYQIKLFFYGSRIRSRTAGHVADIKKFLIFPLCAFYFSHQILIEEFSQGMRFSAFLIDTRKQFICILMILFSFLKKSLRPGKAFGIILQFQHSLLKFGIIRSCGGEENRCLNKPGILRFVLFFKKIPQHIPSHKLCFTFIHNSEIGIEPYIMKMISEHTLAECVYGGYHRPMNERILLLKMLISGIFRQLKGNALMNPLTHLRRCSLCKCNYKKLIDIDFIILVTDKGYDPLDKHSGLSASRCGAYQKVIVPRLYYALLIIRKIYCHFNAPYL